MALAGGVDRSHVEDFLHVLLRGNRRLPARRALLFPGDDSADFFFGVLIFERIEPDVFLSGLAERQVLAVLDRVPGFLKQIKKCFKGVRMLGKRVIDGDTRKLPTGNLRTIPKPLAVVAVRIALRVLDDRQLMLQTDQVSLL